ncbi:BTAD domain-containing putative transcriptional regulator [Amycolatopsis jiangsuensis]|uniref:DNA-binding SARP family transcriptional activator n=1 Tax=Amycolatopsis jiangsuensis TaxID=1181879 RepID=A0A840J5U3_9PSEU|nr:BTAD domain-containing putative transcriptional regulator [Amycolatopsis jiangsuensis]MBB4688787.1 DNA-binding SARP family transcriptional activator [Amycolatopsis jiangsuensis]
MEFSLLGPLEVTSRGRRVPLGGVKQRLTLALLLLRHNSLISVNQLLDALWPDEAPVSARKMLHNAVSGLRKMLATDESPEPPLLLTRSPGYLLRIQPHDIDLVRFHQVAVQGHAALAGGCWEQASELLTEATGMWRGAALSDLADQALDWPELGTVGNARLTALEDRMEADFHLGRYREILTELEVLVEQEPLRERLCGLLMRVLYQRGRQADALTVYSRTRGALVEQLGLDPSPELQQLEHAILTQDSSLDQVPDPVVAGPRSPEAPAAGADPAENQPAERVHIPLEEVKRISTVVIAAGPAPGLSAVPRQLAAVRDYLDDLVRAEARARRARVATADGDGAPLLGRAHEVWQGITGLSPAPVWLVTAGAEARGEAEPWQALQLAHAINGRLTAEPRCHTADGQQLPFEVRVVVATGPAVVRHGGPAASWPQPSDELVELCLRLLADDAAGPVRVCPTTTEAVCLLNRPDHLPFVGREHELAALDAALEGACTLRQPHLLTLFGEAGSGRTRLLDEWRRRSPRAGGKSATVLVGRTPSAISAGSRVTALAELVRAAAGIGPADAMPFATARLGDVVNGLVDERRAPWILSHLSVLLEADPGERAWTADTFDAWAQFFEALAARGPMVLVVENLQWSSDLVLDFVDHLLESSGGVSLLVVASARPDLLARRRSWGGGKLHSTSLSLRPLGDAETARVMWEAFKATRSPVDAAVPADPPETVVPLAGGLGGNPLFAIEYGKRLTGPDLTDPGCLPETVPYSVRSRLEVALDLLPAEARAVLYDVAIGGAEVTEAVVATLAAEDGHRTSGRWLRLLVNRGVLRCVRHPGETTSARYAFTNTRLREVALSRVPGPVRARKEQLIHATRMPRPGEGNAAVGFPIS